MHGFLPSKGNKRMKTGNYFQRTSTKSSLTVISELVLPDIETFTDDPSPF